ncbi:hypothetical protein BXY53_2474 [Dichotomicrobium thermohalophilum]|uniref:Uncharacterized protein n=1 Tax=Dichotomicrobium thermohalophilum TaxID=933063 RepID=A0A397PD23_9HYPH|nr:hypothetical protein BXY53_2474 [Dichotomicrobium thermohalophilum]
MRLTSQRQKSLKRKRRSPRPRRSAPRENTALGAVHANAHEIGIVPLIAFFGPVFRVGDRDEAAYALTPSLLQNAPTRTHAVAVSSGASDSSGRKSLSKKLRSSTSERLEQGRIHHQRRANIRNVLDNQRPRHDRLERVACAAGFQLDRADHEIGQIVGGLCRIRLHDGDNGQRPGRQVNPTRKWNPFIKFPRRGLPI